MSTIPAYPPPSTALGDADLVLGFADGKTVAIPAATFAAYVLSNTALVAELLFGSLVDVNGGEPPVGPGLYLDGGVVKFNAGN